jgi:hypothetical protein
MSMHQEIGKNVWWRILPLSVQTTPLILGSVLWLEQSSRFRVLSNVLCGELTLLLGENVRLRKNENIVNYGCRLQTNLCTSWPRAISAALRTIGFSWLAFSLQHNRIWLRFIRGKARPSQEITTRNRQETFLARLCTSSGRRDSMSWVHGSPIARSRRR